MVVCTLDNLLKGAATQALQVRGGMALKCPMLRKCLTPACHGAGSVRPQNLNLSFGYPELEGIPVEPKPVSA